jgi:hypothetical protein
MFQGPKESSKPKTVLIWKESEINLTNKKSGKTPSSNFKTKSKTNKLTETCSKLSKNFNKLMKGAMKTFNLIACSDER